MIATPEGAPPGEESSIAASFVLVATSIGTSSLKELGSPNSSTGTYAVLPSGVIATARGGPSLKKLISDPVLCVTRSTGAA